MPALRELGLRGCGVGGAGVRALGAALGAADCVVCSVDLAGNPLVGSLAGGLVFGSQGRGPLFRFDELLLRR